MKAITICGSMTFQKLMKDIVFQLETRYGFNVLQCTYNEHDQKMTNAEYSNLVQAHLQKILFSDGIFVVDMNDYIGKSISKEIAFVKKNQKEVIYYSKFIQEHEMQFLK